MTNTMCEVSFFWLLSIISSNGLSTKHSPPMADNITYNILRNSCSPVVTFIQVWLAGPASLYFQSLPLMKRHRAGVGPIPCCTEHDLLVFLKMVWCSHYFISEYHKAPQDENAVSESSTAIQRFPTCSLSGSLRKYTCLVHQFCWIHFPSSHMQNYKADSRLAESVCSWVSRTASPPNALGEHCKKMERKASVDVCTHIQIFESKWDMVNMLRKTSKSARNNHLSSQSDWSEVSELSGSLRQPTTVKSQTTWGLLSTKSIRRNKKFVN